MADISKIQLENNVYDIKDSTARSDLADYETSNDLEIANLKLPKNFTANKKFLLIGDSYAEGYTPDGNTTPWTTLFDNTTGLTNTIVKAKGGAGFVNLADNKNFQTLLEEVTSDNSVTDIVVLGGYNDKPYNQSQVYNSINSFIIKANEKFPNAKIHIGFVGWSKISTDIYPLQIICQYYKDCCGYYNAEYLNNIEYSLHRYFTVFSSDGYHPNSAGQTTIARNLLQALATGSCNSQFQFASLTLSYNNVTGDPFGNDLTVRCNENLVTVSLSTHKTINFTSSFNASSGFNEVEIGTITGGFAVGTQYYLTRIPIQCLVHDSAGFHACMGTFIIKSGKVYLSFADINDGGTNYRDFTSVNQIIISGFSGAFDSQYI